MITIANASALEIEFTAPSAIGFLIACALLILSIHDEILRRRAGIDGLVRLDTQKAIWTSLCLAVALFCVTQIGVNAMMTPPNPNIATDPTTASTSVNNAQLFILLDGALITLAIYRFFQRGAVRREVEHSRDEHRRRAGDPPPGPA